MVAVAALLAACGNSNDSASSSVSLRVANATLTHPTLDLLVNGGSVITGTAEDTVSTYASPSSGVSTLQLNDGTTPVSTTSPTLTGGQHYTLLAYESGGSVK